MARSIGSRVGPYEIVARIGGGGMGEVFKAVDTRLDRNVAIKIFREEFADDVQQRRRFEREARTISQLEHPHVCRLYDLGDDYLVMELLEGQSLRAALTEAPLPAAKAREYAMQIADGLAAAHERGIVHRDLKPENIFITSEGRVKILDFGLAKHATVGGEPRSFERVTSPEVVLGTVGYMAPEQIRGKAADHRSDIFALGAIIYEMVTGHLAFDAGSAVESMSAVLHADAPNLDVTASPLHGPLNEIIRHCLEKNPSERFQSARDLSFDLRTIVTSSAPHPTIRRSLVRPGRLVVLAALLLAGLAIGWAISTRVRPPPVDAPELRSVTQLTFQAGVERFVSLSPDAKMFLYVSNAAGNPDIYLQRVDGRNSINLTKDSPLGDYQPAFSADGEQIAFRSERDGGGIFIMGATGESVRRVTDFGFNPSWSPDGTKLVFSSETMDLGPRGRSTTGGLSIVEIKTGVVRTLTRTDSVQPNWSPNGERIAYWGTRPGGGQRDLWTISPHVPEPDKTIVEATNDKDLDWNPVWSSDGKWLYFGSDRDGTLNLWRIAIDEKSGKTAGDPQPLNVPAQFAAHFSVARSADAFALVSFSSTDWIDRYSLTGPKATPPQRVLSGALQLHYFEVSPDGKQLVFSTSGVKEDLFIVNTDGSNLRQITNDVETDRGPSWSPDGRLIYFYSQRAGNRYEIHSIRPDGSGLTQVTRTQGEAVWYPRASPDGTRVLVSTAKLSAIWHIAAARMEILPKPDPQHVMTSAVWSPDGRRIAGVRRETSHFARPNGIAIYSVADRRYEDIIDIPADAVKWTTDGRSLVFSQFNQSFSVIDLTTKEVRDLGVGAGSFIRRSRIGSTFAVTDDSLYVLASRLEGDIWLVRPKTGQAAEAR